MNAYFDTGVLVKLYCPEANTPEAVKLVQRFQPPLPFCHWQEIEIENALRLKVFRKEFTPLQLKKALVNFQEDIGGGLFKRVSYDMKDVFRVAGELSGRYAMTLGCRTLDILHVAVAKVIGVETFVTFDTRQAAVAAKAGLKVLP
ncbi:MAG: type II toxin-antitoxin system VapC family toxin [Verrucomicrobia bacterium]|nr:type II toxin-antitoxin system VapC family toxin [Verrucomicrobiota bacterium]